MRRQISVLLTMAVVLIASCDYAYSESEFVSTDDTYEGEKVGASVPLNGFEIVPGEPDDPYYNYFEMQTIREVKLHFMNTCGKMNGCSSASKSQAQSAINGMNALHYRSGSEVRFIIDDNTNFAWLRDWDVIKNSMEEVGLYIQDLYGAATVFIHNGSGGASSCKGHGILMGSLGNSDDLSHETGHYLCSGHTFKGAYTTQEVKDKIKKYVDDGNASPWQNYTILRDLFDGDWGQVDPSDPIVGYLSDYRIKDTPPDAGGIIFADANNGDYCGIQNNTVDIVVDNFNDPYDGISHTYTFETDRRNVSSYFKWCFPGYNHFSRDQVAKIEATTVHHRAPVTTFRSVATWRNQRNVAIPSTDEFPGMAISEINVNASHCAVKKAKRITVGVDIGHRTGGLYIQLESPDGYLYELHKPKDNSKDGFRLASGLKTLFYVNAKNGSVFKDGLWQLIVYEGGGAPDHPNWIGWLYDWQIQFTDSTSGISLPPYDCYPTIN